MFRNFGPYCVLNSYIPVILYGCDILTLALIEGRGLRGLSDKRNEITGNGKKLHNTELHALYSSPNIISNLKSND